MPMSGDNTADKIIRRASWLKLLELPSKERAAQCQPVYSDGLVQLGRFVIGLHCHDTGNSFRVWAFDADDKAMQIVNATFWHSSVYMFNKETWIHGEALQAFDRAIAELAVRVHEAEAAKAAGLKAKEDETKSAAQQKIDALNASFKVTNDSEPNPNRFYKWILELEVNETWVADGFNLTEKQWKDWAADGLAHLNASEFRTRVIHAPSVDSIAKAQGFDSADELAAAKARR